ncbi:LytR family transcriptional regulator [Streptomyces sp. SID10853]|uniref:LCP family protein n=1 Tax=Streptomyces sp. SID10853 TaxID=2706028 RepID=UPI0013C05C39|nr:LCP family protein [Streptomyces sp. SID10853]NDZ78561.1 LytR family transcriptional regulator [Streptomyces sp. SID10853]
MDADVTDSAGTPDDEPQTGGPDEDPSKSAPEPPAGRKRHWVRWTALGVAFVVLVAAGVGWWLYNKLDHNIRTDNTATAELRAYEKERPPPVANGAENILLIGSDSRAGDNKKYGRDEGSQRSDTTILLHLSTDKKSATAVSLPRDLMSHVPSCMKADKSRTKKQFVQFNWAFEYGGTACTVRTVENMTGIRIDHYMVVDFEGFKGMVDAVDGVQVCLKKPVNDKDAHLKLPAGRQTLNGEQALGYVRVRHSIGNGSDTERMQRQQEFLGSLVKKVQSNGVLLNPTRLYPVLDAATKSLTTDPGLDTLKDLYNLTRRLRDIPTHRVQFLTVPREPYVNNRNRDQLVQPAADRLFKRLRDDDPVTVTKGGTGTAAGDQGTQSAGGTSGTGGKGKPSPSPQATFPGTNAASAACG